MTVSSMLAAAVPSRKAVPLARTHGRPLLVGRYPSSNPILACICVGIASLRRCPEALARRSSRGLDMAELGMTGKLEPW